MIDMSQAILDSLTDQVALIDHKGTILFVNKAWVRYSSENFNDSCEHYIGMNYLSVCQENTKKGILAVLNGTQSLYTFEYPCHHLKQLRWFLLRVTPINLENNQLFGAVISHINITERKLAELTLARKEEHYRLITNNSTDFISLHTGNGQYTFASPICYYMLGYQPSELVDQTIYQYIHPDDLEEVAHAIKMAQFQEGIQTVTYRIRCENKTYIWFETKLKGLFTTERLSEELIFISRDVTEKHMHVLELQDEQKRLQQKIYTDELTGVYNRRLFNSIIEKQIKEFEVHQQSFSLVMIDIDYFKQFNDTYGHVEGDICLRLVAKSMENYLQHCDFIFRVGGEEFCVLLPNTKKQQAKQVANGIRKAVENLEIPHETSPVSPYITISLGIYTLTGQDDFELTIGSLLEKADQALYEAKKSGRNQICVFS